MTTAMSELMNLANIIDEQQKSNEIVTSEDNNDEAVIFTTGTKRSYDTVSDHSSDENDTKIPHIDESNKDLSATSSERSSIPRRWTPDEDDRLTQAVKMFGEVDWKINSDFVGTRDNVQCRQRWQKVLFPGLHKGKWTIEEDILLRYLVSLRLENWGVVAQRLPGRTSKQCRERWCHHLAPNVDKSQMTREDDDKLVELHQKFGNKWSKIAQQMPGRTENMVRSRIQILKKAMEVDNSINKADVISSSSSSSASSSSSSSKSSSLSNVRRSYNNASSHHNHAETISKLVHEVVIPQSLSHANANALLHHHIPISLPPSSSSTSVDHHQAANNIIRPTLSSKPVYSGSVDEVYEEIVNPTPYAHPHHPAPHPPSSSSASASTTSSIMAANAQLMQQYAYHPQFIFVHPHHTTSSSSHHPLPHHHPLYHASSNLTPPQMYASLPLYPSSYPPSYPYPPSLESLSSQYHHHNQPQHHVTSSTSYYDPMMNPAASCMQQMMSVYPSLTSASSHPASFQQGRQRILYSELLRSYATADNKAADASINSTNINTNISTVSADHHDVKND